MKLFRHLTPSRPRGGDATVSSYRCRHSVGTGKEDEDVEMVVSTCSAGRRGRVIQGVLINLGKLLFQQILDARNGANGRKELILPNLIYGIFVSQGFTKHDTEDYEAQSLPIKVDPRLLNGTHIDDLVGESTHRGGLGIRRMRETNMTFMAKLGWRLLNGKDTLWARVITSKYNPDEGGIGEWREKQWCSNLWKGIVKSKDLVEKMEAIRDRGGGNNRHAQFPTPREYDATVGEGEHCDDKDLKLIWKQKVPNKIYAFLWLLKHDRLMTNVERCRKRFIDDEALQCAVVLGEEKQSVESFITAKE
nr:uncharacterized protein LOC109160503 [Ipomoea trifida]